MPISIEDGSGVVYACSEAGGGFEVFERVATSGGTVSASAPAGSTGGDAGGNSVLPVEIAMNSDAKAALYQKLLKEAEAHGQR